MASAFPGSERCSICNQLITDPEDHTAIGRITDDLRHPLHAHNHSHFHRTCLAVWPQLSALIDELEAIRTDVHGAAIQRTVMDLVTLRASAA